MARYCSRQLNCRLLAGSWSRLLIELNRSADHPQLWSEFSARLKPTDRKWLMQKVYLPYRNKVKNQLHSIIARGNTARHFSVHSFTPVWQGIEREVDIGILLDPSRQSELEWANCLFNCLCKELPESWRIRFNEPYHGTDDGLTTALRQEFADECYSGIEIELSQRIFQDMPRITGKILAKAMANALHSTQDLTG